MLRKWRAIEDIFVKLFHLILNEIEKITRDLVLQDFNLDLPLQKDALVTKLSEAIVYLLLHDLEKLWNLLYRIDVDAIVIVEVFSKKTGKTPKGVIETCKASLREYDNG